MISGPGKDKINAELSAIEGRITDIFSRFELLDKRIPTPQELRSAFKASDPGSKIDPVSRSVGQTSFYSVFDQYIMTVGRQNGWTAETYRKLHNAKSLLQEFNPRLTLTNLTEEDLTGFLQFLYKKKYMNSYIAKTLSYLNWFLRWSKKRGYYNGNLNETFKPRIKGLSGHHDTIIYFAWEEVQYLFNFTPPVIGKKQLQKTLDTFLFCCFTGLRHSDVYSLKKNDVKKDSIVSISKKGTKRVEIELNKYSRSILEKYKGVELPRHQALPAFTNQTMNDHLKIICKAAGFDELVHVVYWRANRRYDEILPKYELITTHAGRRSFIVNGIYLGISPEVIREWTGHADYNEMRPYIAIVDKLKKKEMSKFDV